MNVANSIPNLTPGGLPIITPEAFEAWQEQGEGKYQEVCSKLASEQPMLCWIFEFEKKAEDEESGLPWLVMFYHLFLLQTEANKEGEAVMANNKRKKDDAAIVDHKHCANCGGVVELGCLNMWGFCKACLELITSKDD